MSGYPNNKGDFDEGVDKIIPEVEKVETKVRECTQKADSVSEPPGFWESLGQFALGTVFPIAGVYFSIKQVERLINDNPEVKEKLEEAGRIIVDVLAELGRLASPGNPFIMKILADSWDEVNIDLTGIKGPLDNGRFRAVTTWTDEMGTRYANVPSAQLAALEGMLPHLSAMRDYLRGHSDKLVQLYWDIWMEILRFIGEAIPLAAQFLSANPLKWVDIAKSIADCIKEVLATIRNLVDLVFTFTMESNGQIEALKSAASDVSGTDFGKWPQARLV